MNEMTMTRRTQADFDAVLARDAQDRAGQDRELLITVQKTEVLGRQTPEHNVVFVYAGGPIKSFDGARWETWATQSRRKA